KELGDKENSTDVLVEKIKRAKMPKSTEEIALKELKRYEQLPSTVAETGIVRNYIEWLLTLPWYQQTEDMVDITYVEDVLHKRHYGLEKVKERILEYLAVQQLTNSLKGSVICLVGPPGVGKTSLVRSIAVALNRKFVRMSLGGVRDESEIRGHRRT